MIRGSNRKEQKRVRLIENFGESRHIAAFDAVMVIIEDPRTTELGSLFHHPIQLTSNHDLVVSSLT